MDQNSTNTHSEVPDGQARSVRKLAAIMFTDIIGYTAIMSEDEQNALDILAKNRHIHLPLIEKYGGEKIKEIGDGTLVIFTTASDAVLRAARC